MTDGRASPAPPSTSGIIIQQFQQREAPVFHGYPDEDPDEWLKAYERTAKYNRWDDVAKLVNVAFSLACAAFVWFENHERDIDTWENFKQNFRQAFAVVSRARTAETQLNHRRQRPGEPIRDYYEDVLRLCARTDPAMSDERKLEHLMRGVRDEFFAPLISTPPINPAGFYSVCHRVERQLELRRLGMRKAPSFWENDTTVEANDLRTMVRQLIKTELAALRDEIVATIRSELCSVSPSATTARQGLPATLGMKNHHSHSIMVACEVLCAMKFTPRLKCLDDICRYLQCLPRQSNVLGKRNSGEQQIMCPSVSTAAVQDMYSAIADFDSHPAALQLTAALGQPASNHHHDSGYRRNINSRHLHQGINMMKPTFRVCRHGSDLTAALLLLPVMTDKPGTIHDDDHLHQLFNVDLHRLPPAFLAAIR